MSESLCDTQFSRLGHPGLSKRGRQRNAFILSTDILSVGSAETAQWPRMFATLTEDPRSVPSPYEKLTTSCNSSCRGSRTLFWLLWSPTYVCLHTNKSEINFEKIPPLHRTFPFFLTSHLRCFCNCFAS